MRKEPAGLQEPTRGQSRLRGLGSCQELWGSQQGWRRGGTRPPFHLSEPLWLVWGEQSRARPRQLEEPRPLLPQKPVLSFASCPDLAVQ